MATALILPLTNSDAGPWIAALRQLADPASRSDPHITIRYPIRRIHREAIESSRNAAILVADITSPGYFRSHGDSRTIVYLSCSSELLESFKYKPDFPDSVFHVTVYEGNTSDFSTKLLTLLYAKPWRLRIHLSPPATFQEIQIGKAARAERRRDRFSDDVVEALRSIDARYSSRDFLDALDDSERLEAIALVVDHLHAVLTRSDGEENEGSIEYLTQVSAARHQEELWTSAPVPVDGNGGEPGRLHGSVARAGNLVLTPPELVEDIVTHALNAHGSNELHFGDPAFGSGIFFAVLTRVVKGTDRVITTASAVEINEVRAKSAARLWSSRGVEMLVGDYLLAPPTREWNFVVANPPYVRSQDIESSIKEHAAARIRSSLNLDVSQRANLFVYFVLLSHSWMVADATAAWLLPADFMETTYAGVLREYLSTRVSLLRVHTYDPTEMRFENVRVSPAVIVFRKVQPEKDAKTVVSRGGSIGAPKTRHTVRVRDLEKEANWRVVAAGLESRRKGGTGDVRLGDLFRIRRGIATGANSFFVLDMASIAEKALEVAELRPVLPRPRHLPSDGIIGARPDGYPDVEPQLFLIDLADSFDSLSRRAPKLAAYLKSAPPSILGRYIVSRRSPFYSQERRPAAQLVASAMGHYANHTGVDGSPVRFFLNLSDATVLNNYLVLYPLRRDTSRFPAKLAADLFDLLRRIGPEEYRIWGREYSGGMYKLEPRDLAQVRLPSTRREVASLFSEFAESGDYGVDWLSKRDQSSRLSVE